MRSVFLALCLIACTPAQVSASDFNRSLAVVLAHEGGLSNNKADPGGLTKFGISLRFLRAENLDINGDGKVDHNDVISLTRTDADKLYLHKWWNKYHYGRIKDQEIATKIMDASVNMGASQAHKLVQKGLQLILHKPIAVNGYLSGANIADINSLNPEIMHDVLRYEEECFYRAIVKRRPSLGVFLKGWLARAAA